MAVGGIRGRRTAKRDQFRVKCIRLLFCAGAMENWSHSAVGLTFAVNEKNIIFTHKSHTHARSPRLTQLKGCSLAASKVGSRIVYQAISSRNLRLESIVSCVHASLMAKFRTSAMIFMVKAYETGSGCKVVEFVMVAQDVDVDYLKV